MGSFSNLRGALLLGFVFVMCKVGVKECVDNVPHLFRHVPPPSPKIVDVPSSSWPGGSSNLPMPSHLGSSSLDEPMPPWIGGGTSPSLLGGSFGDGSSLSTLGDSFSNGSSLSGSSFGDPASLSKNVDPFGDGTSPPGYTPLIVEPLGWSLDHCWECLRLENLLSESPPTTASEIQLLLRKQFPGYHFSVMASEKLLLRAWWFAVARKMSSKLNLGRSVLIAKIEKFLTKRGVEDLSPIMEIGLASLNETTQKGLAEDLNMASWRVPSERREAFIAALRKRAEFSNKEALDVFFKRKCYALSP
ncbi:hypothetical protein [Nannocystis sp. SCPEA4]|uniref:hypothetical protein n=1 Tax=Nannocystis sp. SCPEA4 TaxID=2996787 RepID=UPI00226D823E|nr:hypothetical protein [Nannocystis sp. SCPEA4]MCY1059915.1 hypothetical protein [Nannocystis sp. SCPEA4]